MYENRGPRGMRRAHEQYRRNKFEAILPYRHIQKVSILLSYELVRSTPLHTIIEHLSGF
jgi:hypothetical protein